MSAYIDSNSVLDKKGIFPQHQSILSIIQMLLTDPRIESFKWIDTGCGKWQIDSQLEDNFSSSSRKKLDYMDTI
jgi:hypothetical protein